MFARQKEFIRLPFIGQVEVHKCSFSVKTGNEAYNLHLTNGNLLNMGAHCQSKHSHSLFQNLNYRKERINRPLRESKFQYYRRKQRLNSYKINCSILTYQRKNSVSNFTDYVTITPN